MSNLRLSCTNCEAQYEVPDDAIPLEGRDVQCSNCGHTWFVERENAPLIASVDARAEAPVEAPAAPPVSSAPPVERERVSERARTVLREEAEREISARKADVPPELEIQPDLGLDSVPAAQAPTSADIRAAAAPVQPNPQSSEVQQEPPVTNTQKRLPDIEEINSTLAAPAAPKPRKSNDGQTPSNLKQKRKRGFRFGFLFALFILAALVAIYVFAQEIAVAVPSLGDEVNNYVLVVNELRQSLFKWTEDLIGAINSAGTDPIQSSDQN